ncbi:hypothetical protein Q9L58_005635 [Maublancomyces gigas]|uniref:Transmembrane protein n=1 Tax=Discina gigas TaxID=1032678 RepID=A0ABR3GI29_9PEZI
MKKRTVTIQICGLDQKSVTPAVDQSVSALLVAVGDMLVTTPIDICGQSITSNQDSQPKTAGNDESDVRHTETSSVPVTIVVNVDVRRQLRLDKQITDICLFVVASFIVVVGSLLVIVGLLYSVGGLQRGIYWAWDSWAELELFNRGIEFVPAVEFVEFVHVTTLIQRSET